MKLIGEEDHHVARN